MKTLREIRQAAGLSQERLAELIGSSQPTIQKLETGRMRLTLDYAVRLAPALGVHPDELVATAMAKTAPAANQGAKIARPPRVGDKVHQLFSGGAESLPRATLTGQQALPIMAAARGGIDQEMFLEDGPIDWIDRPAYLKNARSPYGMYVVGESMMPRFRPQQLLHVNPHKPPAPGSGVIVVKKTKAVLVKEFVRHDSAGVVLREYQPRDREFLVSLEELDAIHTVVGLQEPS